MTYRNEAGVTLVELLIVVALLGVVMPAIGFTFMLGYRTLADTGDRVVESSRVEIATAYWGADVMNSSEVDTVQALGGCDTGGGQLIASMRTGATFVTWVIRDVSSGVGQLIRRACPSSVDATLSGDETLIGAVVPASTTVSCEPEPLHCGVARRITLTMSQPGDGGVTSMVAARRNG